MFLVVAHNFFGVAHFFAATIMKWPGLLIVALVVVIVVVVVIVILIFIVLLVATHMLYPQWAQQLRIKS
jgi:hypothetical protein